MTVCMKRHPVGPCRQRGAIAGASLRVRMSWLWLLGVVLLAGCGDHPEALLEGRWRESGWEYEKFVEKPRTSAKWVDGIDLPGFAERSVIHHEAEYWDFRRGGALVIAKRDGTRLHARWHLKGRGHVLTVRTSDPSFEVYDVKGLDEKELVLNYDVGMEVRGIARLTFRRMGERESSALLSAILPAHEH